MPSESSPGARRPSELDEAPAYALPGTTYRRPRLPVNPTLSLRSFGRRRDDSVPSLLDVSTPTFFTSGRYALAEALRLCGVGRGAQVLLPAYCCPAMVAPVRSMEATPVFYPVQSDLSIDPTDVTRKLTQAAKCVIAVHYFGFLQGLGPLSRLCQEHGAKLIEDCAHCLFGRREDTPVGGVGDFAFGSLAKFFPTYDGGCLVSAKELGEPLPTQRGGLAFQLKSIVNALERSHAYARLQPGPLWDAAFAVKDGILRAAKSARADNASRAPSAADCGYEFEPRWRRVRMSLASTAIMNSISTHKLVEARRTNYEQLLFGLANVPGGRPLRLHLPDEVVPFMFPFRVDDPERVFPALKARGIPMQRWDDAETTCPVSAAYSRELLFFPVHQGLTVEDMDWISATVREVLFSDSR